MLKVLALGRAVEDWSVQASRGSGSVLRGCSWAFLSCSCLRLNARVDLAEFGSKHAAIAQLGERQTEDLKVPGSIPGLGRLHFARARKVRMRPT